MTLISSAVAANDVGTAAQYNDLRKDVLTSAGDILTDAGAANAYDVTLDASITSLATGQIIKFAAGNANTLASTLRVHNASVDQTKNLKSLAAGDLRVGDIVIGQIITCIYDGTQFRLIGGNEEPAGSIKMYAGSAAPTGHLLCDGASYLRATYPVLFAIISTTYGSADGTHFNVPDLRGRVPIGAGTGAGGGASGTGLPTGGSALTARAIGAWKGEETHALIEAELATHHHHVSGYYGAGEGTEIGANNTTVYKGELPTDAIGSGTAHENMQPVMCVNFIIKT